MPAVVPFLTTGSNGVLTTSPFSAFALRVTSDCTEGTDSHVFSEVSTASAVVCRQSACPFYVAQLTKETPCPQPWAFPRAGKLATTGVGRGVDWYARVWNREQDLDVI